jgi:hypothetical protein
VRTKKEEKLVITWEADRRRGWVPTMLADRPQSKQVKTLLTR